jgi:adenine C2-methylase RlmN of 23S rRNA A2503 and tRNA A37
MTNKSKKILSEISAGELLDKISILEIKLEKIEDKNNREEIKKEYKILKEIQNSSIKFDDKIKELFSSIKVINIKLWNVEDELRVCEKNKDFGKNFIELAREVYLNNDKRSKIKSEINKRLGSNIREVKQYVNY